MLPPSKITIETLEDKECDSEMLNILQALKVKNYTIAFDDFILNKMNHVFLPLTDIVKVDWKNSTAENILALYELLPITTLSFLPNK
ncbi:hypothetical protein ACE1TI_17490 [Alteribacillus sp. JSM 102045]|uniref:hypothetical protein n=1 Tax=Alteribacillus sp. JSM 102045 TaxID=1562101 RepID=UPI0035C065C1